MLNKLKGALSVKPAKTFQQVDQAFLFSDEYEQLMSAHLPYPGTYDEHEAQNQTKNFLYRHHEVNHRLGIFRWRGLQKHKALIYETVNASKSNVIDLGGAASPLGLNSTIVDFLPKDIWGRKVNYKYIQDFPEAVDVIFTSHTLEHIVKLEEVLQDVHKKLEKNGKIIVHLPSFYCERWRVGVHINKKYNDHSWDFGLSGTKHPSSLDNYLDIDTLLAKYFDLKIAEFCGDDSIFIVGEKK